MKQKINILYLNTEDPDIYRVEVEGWLIGRITVPNNGTDAITYNASDYKNAEYIKTIANIISQQYQKDVTVNHRGTHFSVKCISTPTSANLDIKIKNMHQKAKVGAGVYTFTNCMHDYHGKGSDGKYHYTLLGRYCVLEPDNTIVVYFSKRILPINIIRKICEFGEKYPSLRLVTKHYEQDFTKEELTSDIEAVKGKVQKLFAQEASHNRTSTRI